MNFEIKNLEAVAGADKAILNGVRESRAYINGVAGAADGLRYEIICFGNGFEKVAVKVPGSTVPPITPEEIAARNAAGDFVYCRFDGFAAKIYENFQDHSMRVSASARAIQIMNGAPGKDGK